MVIQELAIYYIIRMIKIIRIKDALNVDRTKPILLYAPTWHATKDSTELMSISPELIEEYHVIFKRSHRG